MSYDLFQLAVSSHRTKSVPSLRVTAMRPYGYEVDRATVREHEATVLRDAAERILEGESLRSVTASINDAGARTPGGNLWQPNVLRRVLMSERVVGRELKAGGQPRKAPWPPILDARTHRKLVEVLGDRSRVRGGGQANRVYLLTGGVAVCGICGSPLIARPNNDGKRGYVCSSGGPYFGCGKIRINADPFEQDVTERVLARLIRPDARDRLQESFNRAIEGAEKAPEEIKAAEERLAEIGVDYADGNIGATEMRAAREHLGHKIRAARSKVKLAEMLRGVGALDAESLVDWWEGASLNQQRALLELMVDKIAVHPVRVRGSKIFDPSRVEVTWRRWGNSGS
jgi:hypothetical protein